MELLTVNETAQILRVSPITVRRYIASGRLAAERVGRGVRVRPEAIEDFVTPIVPTAGNSESWPKQELPTIREALGISIGIGRSGVPTNVAERKDEYLADAFSASGYDDEEEAEPDDLLGNPFTIDDSRWSIVGAGESDGPTESDPDDKELPTFREYLGDIIGIGRSGSRSDVSANKYEYLAEAYESDKG